MKKFLLSLAALLCMQHVTTAQEIQPETKENFKSWQFRIRGVGVVPNESAKISTIGGDAHITTNFIPEIDISYYFTKNLAVELILGTSKHKVNTVGSDISAIGGPTNKNIDLGSAWLLPPTLTVQYHFYPGNVVKPYVGAGVNYTMFYNEKPGNTVKNVSYDNTFGLATQVGMDIMVSKYFFINMDVKYIFMKTDVSVDASNLATGLVIPAKVDINPLLLGFGVGVRI